MKLFWKYLGTAALCGLALILAPAAQARVLSGYSIMDQPMGENLCALTFDDGPSANTPQLLETLAEYGIPATFFLLGSQAERYPALVKRILAEGHEVGNHSYSHPNLRLIKPERKAEEIRRTDAILRGLGASPQFMRPPYGVFDAYSEQVAESLGMTVALWSMDSRDWQRLPENYATLRNPRGAVYAPGALRGVFLFHDTHKRTVDDLPRIVRDLRAGGCQRFVTLSDYVEGLMDPEPGLLMTRRDTRPAAPVAGEMPLAARHEIQGLQQAEEPPQSFPAGSSPLPLARSSRPWQPGAAAHAPEQASGQPVQAEPQAAAPDASQLRLPQQASPVS